MAIPDGTIKFEFGGEGSSTYIIRCDICYAAILLNHDADYQLHVEWHENTRTDIKMSLGDSSR